MIVANVIGGISRNVLLMTTKRMQCFALHFESSYRGRGGGQDTSTIGIRGKNAFATTTDNFRQD